MTIVRQPYYALSPAAYDGFIKTKKALEKSALGETLIELIYLRVSQINGCAFCLEMHSKALRGRDVDPLQRTGAGGAGVGGGPDGHRPLARRRRSLSAAAGPLQP